MGNLGKIFIHITTLKMYFKVFFPELLGKKAK
jgi:hypothetical protein